MTQPQHSNSQSNNQQQSRETTLNEWYDNLTPEARQLRQAYGIQGFDLVTTGGGCTAFACMLDGGYEVLITDGEAEAPRTMDEEVCIYLLKPEQCEPIEALRFANTPELLTELYEHDSDLPRFFRSYPQSHPQRIHTWDYAKGE